MSAASITAWIGLVLIIIGIILGITAIIWNRTSSTNGTDHTWTTSMKALGWTALGFFIFGVLLLFIALLLYLFEGPTTVVAIESTGKYVYPTGKVEYKPAYITGAY